MFSEGQPALTNAPAQLQPHQVVFIQLLRPNVWYVVVLNGTALIFPQTPHVSIPSAPSSQADQLLLEPRDGHVEELLKYFLFPQHVRWLLAHGAAAELSPRQHSWLRPPRRVPGGPGPSLSAPINARAAPRIKNNRHHLCALRSRFEADSCGCENKQGTRSGKGLTRSLRPNPESHGGIGAREAPAAEEEAPGWYSPGDGSCRSLMVVLQQDASCTVPPGTVPFPLGVTAGTVPTAEIAGARAGLGASNLSCFDPPRAEHAPLQLTPHFSPPHTGGEEPKCSKIC